MRLRRVDVLACFGRPDRVKRKHYTAVSGLEEHWREGDRRRT